MQVRDFIKKRLANASVSRVDIERPAQTAKVTVYTARPGIVIGKKGEDVEKLRGILTKKNGSPGTNQH
jgi:small subunit ribosomal protein S3